MKKQPYKYTIGIFVLVLLAILICWWLKSQNLILPVTDRNVQPERSREVTTEEITLFFADHEGKLVAEKRQISRCDTRECRVQAVVKELCKGSFRNFERLLPPETDINNVSFVADTANIDLLPVFAEKLPSGSYAEMMAVYSIINSICATMPEVKYIKLSIAGNPNSHLRHLDLSESLMPDFEL